MIEIQLILSSCSRGPVFFFFSHFEQQFSKCLLIVVHFAPGSVRGEKEKKNCKYPIYA